MSVEKIQKVAGVVLQKHRRREQIIAALIKIPGVVMQWAASVKAELACEDKFSWCVPYCNQIQITAGLEAQIIAATGAYDFLPEDRGNFLEALLAES